MRLTRSVDSAGNTVDGWDNADSSGCYKFSSDPQAQQWNREHATAARGRRFVRRRIGHLGDLNDLMIAGALSGVEMGLAAARVPFTAGGVTAALAYMSRE